LEAQKLMEDVARMRAAIDAASTKPALAAVKAIGTPRKLVSNTLTSSPVTLGSSSPFTEEQRVRKEQEMHALVDEVSALEAAAQEAAKKASVCYHYRLFV
jgi:DNA polymerase III sliding clamp (beta) subunit (PCNA family)